MPSTRRAGGGRAPAASIVTARKLAIFNKVADAVAPRSGSEPVRLLDDAFVTDAYHQALATLGDAAIIRNPGIETYVALLRLYAGLMRPSACTDAASGISSNAAQAGGGNSSSPPAAVIRRRSRLLATVLDVARKGCPFPTAEVAHFALLFVRCMLAAQPLHALSHQLAAAAAALEPCGDGAGGGPGGADVDAAAIEQGRAALGCFLENTCTFYKVFLGDADIADLEYPSPVMVGAVAAERAAGVEELARGLAESGVLEHAARVLLLLQARGPQAVRPREGMDDTLAWEVRNLLYWLAWWATGPPCISPTAAALLHSALSGRCVQTAVLVYGVGTLRLVDRGPTYGLPVALQTAGLAVCEPGQRSPGILSLVLLASIPASGDPLAIAGPGTSVELLLRTSRAALGSAAAALPQGLQPWGGVPLPAAPAVPLTSSPSLLGLALSTLQVARTQLPACDASARQSQRREEWWRLAAGALAYGGEFLQGEEYGTDPDVVAWELCWLVTEPLLQLWPNGRRDLDALPAEPPTEVAAALAGGLPQAVMALMGSSGTGALSVGSQRVACELLKACCNPLFLTPLLVYGGSESVAAFLGMLGSARRDRHGQARAPPPAPQQCPALRAEAAEAAEPMQPPAAAAGVVGPWGMRCGAATGRSWRGRR